MSHLNKIRKKIYLLEELKPQLNSWKNAKEKIVFTNGCFDLIHRGHVEVLARTADLGEKLIVGLNSDSSIKKIKGENRPIITEQSRALLLASLSFVDAVVLFSEKTPINLIKTILPNILAKGGDYEVSSIVGNEIVQNNGGEVVLIPFVDGCSSSNIIEIIKNS